MAGSVSTSEPTAHVSAKAPREAKAVTAASSQQSGSARLERPRPLHSMLLCEYVYVVGQVHTCCCESTEYVNMARVYFSY